MEIIKGTADLTAKSAARRHRTSVRFIKTLFQRRIVVVAAIVVLLFVIVAVFAKWIAPYDPNEQNYSAYLSNPSLEHPLGTDKYGRDLLSRLIYGAQVSLLVGVVAVSVGAIVGTLIGMVAGYFVGTADIVIMRICEAVMGIPQIILCMALRSVMGSSLIGLVLILGFTSIPGYVRMMRAQVLSARNSDYIMAAQVQGNRSFSIMLKHILPNCISPIIVMMSQTVGATILAEAGLSFLGLGISPPTPAWGGMVSDGRDYLTQLPIFALSPGVCVILLVMSLNILGDGLRDALDPRLRGNI